MIVLWMVIDVERGGWLDMFGCFFDDWVVFIVLKCKLFLDIVFFVKSYYDLV